MDLELRDKRALVTGGSRGIGRAIAQTLANEGARVAIAARDLDAIERTAEALRDETGGDVRGFSVDTRIDASVNAMVEAVANSFGGIDILVNAAANPGRAGPGATKLPDVTSENALEELNTKALGYLRCARAVAPYLTQQGWGRIINISGLAARQTGSIVGSMRNVAVAALTKNLADELGPFGVNVTTVHPGATRTERWDRRIADLMEAEGITEVEALRRDAERLRSIGAGSISGHIVSAAEVAAVVAFLASPKSVAINGDSIGCGGGAPGSIYY